MSYELLILTHGEDSNIWVQQALSSFRSNVEPEPSAVHVFHDPGLGFCGATRKAWGIMVGTKCEFVFWLEHDFIFRRSFDLLPIMDVLRENQELAQMSFIRQAVNEREQKAGGLVESYREAFEPQEGWFRHRAYFTTNPSLMRRQFMEANPWPEMTRRCEGHFAIGLIQAGYQFGAWGDGTPWVQHCGHRTGFGY